MEENLKLILNKLDSMGKDINELKEGQKKLEEGQKKLEGGQKKLEKEVKENFDHVTKEIFQVSVRLEDTIEKSLQGLDTKIDKIYNSTVSISKKFTDTTQELPVLISRQMEHTEQLEDHEGRLSKLDRDLGGFLRLRG